MALLLRNDAYWFYVLRRYGRSFTAAAAYYNMGAAAIDSERRGACRKAVGGSPGVKPACGRRGRNLGGQQREEPKGKVPVPGAAVAAVPGNFSGQRRIKAASNTKANQSLYAEELSRCENSSQVLQLLSRPPFSSDEQMEFLARPREQEKRRHARQNVPLPYLLPVDCLAFLNALLRVQQLRRSGTDFLFFCQVLEDTLQRYNARWLLPPSSSDLPQNSANAVFPQRRESDMCTDDKVVGPDVRGAPSLRCRPPPHAGRFIRLVLQKLSDLKAPLAFNQMVPYLQPHVPTLSPFDVAECLWSFAVLQPPDWQIRHVPLLIQLLQRLLTMRSVQSKERTQAGVCTAGTFEGANGMNDTVGGDLTDTAVHAATAVTDTTKKRCLSNDTELRRLQTRREKERWLLPQFLEWVAETSPQEGDGQSGSKRKDAEEHLLLLDDLSNLMIYRVVFAVAKLDLRCRTAQQVYQVLAPRIVDRLTQQGVEAFPPAYLVRMSWAYGRLRVRHVPFYRRTCSVLKEVLEDLSYKELKVVKHVYEALELTDKTFLGAVDLLLHQMRELNGNFRAPVTA